VDERVILISCFAVGVALQAAFLLRGGWSPLKLAGCVGVALVVGVLPGRSEQPYDPYAHSLIVIGIFSVAFAIAFSKDVLSLVTERSVLFYTVLLWFAFFSYGYEGTSKQNTLMAITLVPTAVTAYWTFRDAESGFWVKLVLYAWYLCTIVALALYQFSFDQLGIFLEKQKAPTATPLDSFAAGMGFMFLVVNATYLYLLVPIPGKRQSWRQRMEEWHELTDVMTQRLLAEDLNLPLTGLCFLGLVLLLALDCYYLWVAPSLVINILLVAPGIVLTRVSVGPASSK